MTSPAPAPQQDAVAVDTGRSLWALLVALGLAQFGVMTALMAPAVSGLAVRVAEIAPRDRNASLSLVLGVGAIVAMVASPVLGAFSDRTRSRFGRRTPWIVGGTIGGTVGLVALAAADSVPAVLAGWCLCQFAFNATTATILAILADRVPQLLRGRFSAVLGVAQYGALMAATFMVGWLAGNSPLMFLVPGVVGVAGAAVLVVVLSERDSSGDVVEPFSLIRFVRGFWVSPRRHPDFAWAWVSRFFKVAGMFTLTSYQTYFFIDRFGFTPQRAAGYVFLATVVSTVAMVLGNAACGALSDRLGRRKPFVFASATLLAIGLLLLLVHVPFGVLLCFIALIGLGQGVYAGVDVALVVDVLPRKNQEARDLGTMNIAGTLPQSIAPTVAPLLLHAGGSGGNYAALFIGGAIAAGIGAISILFVKGVR